MLQTKLKGSKNRGIVISLNLDKKMYNIYLFISIHIIMMPKSPPHRDSIENIRSLYSPHFPLDVVRDYVMTALQEAVQINQVHNRDPVGGSNENLFL